MICELFHEEAVAEEAGYPEGIDAGFVLDGHISSWILQNKFHHL